MNVILNENCVDAMKNLAGGLADLCITSPPYKNINNYSELLMYKSFNEIYRVLKNNSLFFLNFGSLAEDKFRPFRVCQIAIECGFQLNDTITWVKNHYKPVQGSRRLNNLTEFIFVLYKGKMPKIDRFAVGIPYVDKTNAKRYNKGQDLHCAGNVWYINYPTVNDSSEKLHPDMFPPELPEKCIKLSGLKSGVVLDPYMGSGTVAITCLKHNLNFIGIEKNKEYIKIAEERIIAFKP